LLWDADFEGLFVVGPGLQSISDVRGGFGGSGQVSDGGEGVDLAGNGGLDGVGKMGLGGNHASDCHRSARGGDLREVPFVITYPVYCS
jgi:hypothetical protein